MGSAHYDEMDMKIVVCHVTLTINILISADTAILNYFVFTDIMIHI